MISDLIFLSPHITKASHLKIKTALKICKYTQADFEALNLSVQYLAYNFNRAITPNLDELLEDLKGDAKLPPLTQKQQSLVTEFKKYVSAFLDNLPCFKVKLTETEQKQIYSTFSYHIDNRKGAPLGNFEYVNKINVAYLKDYLVNNFQLVKISNGGLCDIAFWNSETYISSSEALEQLIADILSLEFVDAKKKRYEKTASFSDVYRALELSNLKTVNIAKPSYISCLNGILYLDTAKPLQEPKLLAFTPDIFTLEQFQGNYYQDYRASLPQNTIDKLDRYLELIANKDNDYDHHQEVLIRILESMATILYRGQIFKKFIVVHGKADGGKSKFVQFVLSLLDPSLVSNIKLTRLNSQFGLVGLKNKLVNFADESNFSKKYEDSNQQQNVLKDILSGGFIQSDRKNQSDVRFKANARWIIGTNSYPAVTQESTENKLLYVPFTNNLKNASFTPYYPNANNQDEKDYIFNVLVRALRQVFENFNNHGYYFTPSKFVDYLQDYAKTVADDAYSLIKEWFEDEKPLKDYPIGEPVSDGTIFKMRLSYYKKKFDDYTTKNNQKTSVSNAVFRRYFLEFSDLQEKNAKDRDYKDHTYNNVLLPKVYQNKTINSYKDYKSIILKNEKLRNLTNKAIQDNTQREYERVKAENIETVF